MRVISYIFLFIFALSSRFLFAEVLHVERDVNWNESWKKLESSEKKSLKVLVQLLKKSKTGKNLIDRSLKVAHEQGQSFDELVRPAKGSLTDTTLTRKFSTADPQNVHYESHSLVFIDRDLSVKDGVLDLAHELVHLLEREPFNPYDESFSLVEFMKSTVEGKGGEVEAYLVECQVYRELFPGPFESSRCQQILDDLGRLSKSKATDRFYQLGKYHSSIKKIFNQLDVKSEKIPLSSKETMFISSAYGLPYPLAAVKEYLNIMDKACENDRRRLEVMKLRRTPASKSYLNFKTSFNNRCQSFVSQAHKP